MKAPHTPAQSRSPADYLLVMLKGIAMGAADVVPGVSGGTIAFITGIYEELLASLRTMTPKTLMLLWRPNAEGQQGFAALWRAVNGNFLLALGSGIVFSLLSLARLISYALVAYPVLVWSFFFGLVIASAIYILRQLTRWSWREAVALVAGTAVAVAISIAKPAHLPGDWWMVFGAGAIALCAMILPGVSGSFLLVMMGMYTVVLGAVTSLDWLLLGCFLGGCATGLLVFSHLLHWLLQRFHNITLALLTGFLVGSLNVIWPWKHTLEFVTDRHGKSMPLIQENLLPGAFEAMTGTDPQLLMALTLAVSGIVLVLGLEWVAGGSKTAEK